MLGWFRVGLRVDDPCKVNRVLAEELVPDEELMSLAARDDLTDWDFGDIRVWFAELRVGDLTVGRDGSGLHGGTDRD
jgi:hypothetical protein